MPLEFSVDGKAFSKEVSLAASIAPVKSPRPIMSNILVEAKADSVELIVSDQELWMRLTLPAVKVAEPGSVLLNAERLKGLVKEYDDEEVSLEEKAGFACALKAAEARVQIQGRSPEDYPPFPSGSTSGPIRLDARLLAQMLMRAVVAVDEAVTRYAMNGVLLEADDETLYAVGTDGKALSICSFETGQLGELSSIVPKSGVLTLVKLLKQSEGDVVLHTDDAYLRCVGDGWEIAARLVNGTFPPWKLVMGQKMAGHDKVVSVPRDKFGKALRRAALLEQTDTRAVQFDLSKEGMLLTTRAAAAEDSHISLPLVFDYPDGITLGFAPTYFQSVLPFLDSPFELKLLDSKSAALVDFVEESGLRLIFVVMPINLGKQR